MRLQATLRRWAPEYPLLIVVAMVVLAPLLRDGAPAPVSHRDLILELMGVLLVCAVLFRIEVAPGWVRQLKRFLSQRINGFALAFFGWALISALWVAPAGLGHAFAVIEVHRLALGALVCLVVANQVRNQQQVDILVNAALIPMALVAVDQIFFLPVFLSSGDLQGVHLLVGGLLSLMLPVVAAAAVASSPRPRIRVCGVLFLVVLALLMSSTLRSRLGALVGLALFAALVRDHLPEAIRWLSAGRRGVIYSGAAVAGALALLLMVTGLPGRAASTQPAAHIEQEQYVQRRHREGRTLAAIARRPVLGMGLGNYVLQQYSFTALGRPAELVARSGATLGEQAHNEYLQVAAELGVPGLLLYLLLLLAFLVRSVHAVRRLSAGRSKLLLIGCMAAIAAQCVDAAGNPAWRYSICALYFWFVLGMGAALAQMAEHQPAVLAPGAVPAGLPREKTTVAV
jgi:O-antigen ligase